MHDMQKEYKHIDENDRPMWTVPKDSFSEDKDVHMRMDADVIQRVKYFYWREALRGGVAAHATVASSEALTRWLFEQILALNSSETANGLSESLIEYSGAWSTSRNQASRTLENNAP